ncbi:MAG TPA: hypothetical protein VEC99_01370, partial [Clostridia bacterium]|nr:hypothetical protein [Clostridia bacterium]
EVRTSAAEKTLRVISQDDGARSERVYKFSELQNPQTWLPELAGPFAVTLLSAFPIPSNTSSNALSIPKINWEARHTSVRIGRSPVPAYRLSAKLLDRYQTIIFVSRVGEILRAELPAGIVLINDQLGAF